MKQPRRLIRWASALGGLAAASLALHAAFVLNPSFESNWNEAWPHYGGIDDWIGGSGVNDRSLDRGGPFHDNALTPDRSRVAFKQQNGDLSQDIFGLTPGSLYWIQFYYNSRGDTIGGNCNITTRFGGRDLDTVTGVVRAALPEGGGNITASFYGRSVPFVADADSGTLTFHVATVGDRTALFDAVTMVEREVDDLTVMNPSFEASGMIPSVGPLDSLAGWAGSGTVGVDLAGGAYADNGAVPDQDLVAFIEGEGSLSQTLRHLRVGNQYRITLAYNARGGNVPHLQVRSGATVLWEADVQPVGGANPYRTRSISFTATEEDLVLTFAQTKVGLDAVLIDNVRVQGEADVPLPPLGISPKRAELAPGQQVTVTVSVPPELLARRAADIVLASGNTNVVQLVGAAEDGTVTLHFDQSGGGHGAAAPVAGMSLWLKADAIAGLADGAKVANWADASGQGNDASNAIVANQPTFIANGREGRPVVRFAEGGNDDVVNGVQWLDSRTTVQTKNGHSFSAFIVFSSADTGVSSGNLAGRDNLLQPLDLEPGTTDNLKRGRTLLYVDTYATARRIQTVNNQAGFSAAGDYTPATWTLAGLVQDAAANTLGLYLNGGLDTQAAVGPEGGTHGAWRIGATKQGHGGLQGDIAEIIVYDRALSPAEREEVESYLIGKWNLPAVTTKTAEALAVRRGSASVNVAQSAGLEVPNGVIINVVESIVRNPSFDAEAPPAGAGYGPVLAWNTSGQAGVNRIDQPFAAGSGLIPDRLQVAFIQGVGSLSQTIGGLMPGANYRLQFRYSLRAIFDPNGPATDLTVRYAGQTLIAVPGIVPPADAAADYGYASVDFAPAVASGLLEFVTSNPRGDASVLLDAVNIVRRNADELVVQNSSFEASGAVDLYLDGPMAGWEFTGAGKGTDGDGPFSLGVVPDQDLALFIQGGGSVQQVVPGFTVGATYTLSYAVNCRDFPPGQGTTHYTVQVGTPGLPATLVDEDVDPVGGNQLYPTKYVVFTADASEQVVRFEHAPPPGDKTVLFDNIRIFRGEVSTPVTLTIGLLPDGQVRLAWPTEAIGYSLYSAPAVRGTYALDPSPVSVDGNENVVLVQPQAARFYYLKK